MQGGPLFKTVTYSDDKFVIYTVGLDKTRRLELEYWKLNISFPVRKTYRDLVSNLVKQKLTGGVVNNR